MKVVGDMSAVHARWRQQALKLLASFLFYSGAFRLIKFMVKRLRPRHGEAKTPGFPFVCRRRAQNLQILLYHRVNDEYDPFFPAVPVAVFARQMDYLASRFHFCPLEEALARLRQRDLPDNTAVVTFDDGYRDNYLYAFPILNRLSIPATIFLATGAIGSGKVLWHDRVLSAFRETHEPVLRAFGPGLATYPLRTMQEKFHAQIQVRGFLRSLDNEQRAIWTTRLIEQLGVEDRQHVPSLMLTWDEVKIMHQAGIAFGSHSVSHAIFSRLSTARAQEEIHVSKSAIEKCLGVSVTTFAYPNGAREDFTDETKRLLQNAGYTCAVTAIFGANEIGQDAFALHRGQPWEHHLPTFAAKLYWYKYASSSQLAPPTPAMAGEA